MNSNVGSVPIPSFIIEQIPLMSAAEAVCTMVLATATYGSNERMTWLTYADFQKHTMYKGTATIATALKAVVKRGFFRRRPEGSMWEVVESADTGFPSTAEVSPFISAGDTSIIEAETSANEVESSITEARSSNSEVDISIFDVNPSNYKVNGPKTGPYFHGNSPKIEPLPLYKEKESIGKCRERERKRARAREDHHGAYFESREFLHPGIPTPHTREEKKLARHPATAAWLEAKMAWPGWEKLAVIARRLGPEPQKEKLRRAREMWMMSGYRLANIHGILDWYEALCQDETWQPFVRRGMTAGSVVPDMNAPQSPAMAMLFEMKKENLNGKSTDNSGLFDHAASGISALGSWGTDSQDLPALPG